MQTEVENVLKVGDMHNMPHWKVYHGTNIRTQQIYCSSEDINMPSQTINWEVTKPVLRNYLMYAPTDATYTIHFKSAPDDKNDLRVMTFRLTPETNAGIAGMQNQYQSNMPPQFMMQNMMQYFTAEIGRVTTQITADFEKKELNRKIEELQKELKKKAKDTGSSLTEIFREIKSTVLEVKALHDAQKQPERIAIGVTGQSAPPLPAETKKETTAMAEKTETDKPVMNVSTPEMAKLYNETLAEMQEMFGSGDETVINLFCLKELFKDKKILFDNLIVPELKKYREVLDEMGITAGK